MAESGRGWRRRERIAVNALWLASGAVVIVGFLLRPAARYFGSDLRVLGMVVIAAGILLAFCAWIGEKLVEDRK